MGEIIDKDQKWIYYSLFSGKITTRLKEPGGPGPEYVTRTNKDGVTVHEKHINGIAGHLLSVSVKDEEGSKYGPQWEIVLFDGEQYQKLQIKYSSKQAESFLKRLHNVDLAASIEVRTLLDEKNDKKNTVLWVTQGLTVEGKPKTVPYFFGAKDNANGLPDWESKEEIKDRKKVIVWNNNATMAFLEKDVNEWLTPKLKAMHETGEIVKDKEPVVDQNKIAHDPNTAKGIEVEGATELPF